MTSGIQLREVCCLLRIDPRRIPEYLENVWLEKLEALRVSHYRNYSMFVDDLGLFVGYLEAENLEVTLAAMSSTEINAAWSAHTGDMFLPVDERRPVGTVIALQHAFDLDATLAKALS